MGRILVVEDDPLLAETIEELLTSVGHDVAGTSSPVDALDVAPIVAPDLAIVDVDDPLGEGFEVMTRLQKAMAELEIIAICRVPPGHRRRRIARMCGAKTIVTKPMSSQLIAAVQALVEGGE